MNPNNNRKFICANCKEYLPIDTTGEKGLCSRLARQKSGGMANRDGAGYACYDFNPITENLPPVPEGSIEWISLAWITPAYGGFVLVRWVIINQYGKTVGHKYTTEKTPFDGKFAVKTKELPEDNFRKCIPTHFAYIGEPKV